MFNAFDAHAFTDNNTDSHGTYTQNFSLEGQLLTAWLIR